MVIKYHGTSSANAEKIAVEGLKNIWGDGIYLTDSEDSALKWVSMRHDGIIAVIQVEVEESKLEEGLDHSPLMQELFGCGNSIVHMDDILPIHILDIAYFKKEKSNKTLTK